MSVFYWALYIPIYITALFKKEVEWKPIVHCVHMSQNGDTKVEVSLEESKSAREIDDTNTIL